MLSSTTTMEVGIDIGALRAEPPGVLRRTRSKSATLRASAATTNRRSSTPTPLLVHFPHKPLVRLDPPINLGRRQ